VNGSHEARVFANPAGSDIVIFVHGLYGSPRQFDGLADAVFRQGCSYAALLLPGHGGSARDFASGTFERWQGHVDSEIERYSRDFKNIWLVGHSMGGLLAINAAVKFSELVRGVFTIACPFKITMFSTYAIKIRMRQIFGKKNDPVKRAYLSSKSVVLSPNLIWHNHKPTAEFKKLLLTARSNLSGVRVPVTAVYSTSDELTSFASHEIMKKELVKAPFELVVLTESLHAYYTECEQDVIEQALLKMVL